VTACRRVLGFLDGFVLGCGWGGNNTNPIFLGLSGTGLSDMVEEGQSIPDTASRINYKGTRSVLGP
jgi:hypothetical protein